MTQSPSTLLISPSSSIFLIRLAIPGEPTSIRGERDQIGWMPHGGLALANSLATALEMVGLWYFMRRRLAG